LVRWKLPTRKRDQNRIVARKQNIDPDDLEYFPGEQAVARHLEGSGSSAAKHSMGRVRLQGMHKMPLAPREEGAAPVHRS
jgi:hypothetical protein